jgi:DNA-binding CsgD family transcriptional regulator
MAGLAGDPGAAVMRSSVAPGLMRDYVDARIFEDDPFLPLCARESGEVDLDVAEALGGGASPGGRRLARLFDAHGIAHATLLPVWGGAHPGGLVLYARCPEEVAALRDGQNRLRTRLVAALFASRCSPGDEAGPPRYVTSSALSPRERETLQWLAAGLQTARIAERMGVAVPTVEKHLAGARARLGARTREQALAIALTRGEIDL